MPAKDTTAVHVASDLEAMGLKPLVRIPELCKLLSVSRESLYRAIKIGELAAMRCGGPRGNFVLRRDDIATWLARHRTS